MLSCNGYASILTFKNKTSHLLLVMDIEGNKDLDASIEEVTKQIEREITAIVLDWTKYRGQFSVSDLKQSVSKTLQCIVLYVSVKLEDSLPALMVGHIVTSVLKDQSTDLQLANGVLLRSSKAILSYMHDFRITCTYDEVLQFKKSAAIAATDKKSMQGLQDLSNGMSQAIIDNFDVDIHSPNSKLSTHSLGVIITQTPQDTHEEDIFIPRLKCDQKSITIPEEPLCDIAYSKNPAMPKVPAACAQNSSPLKMWKLKELQLTGPMTLITILAQRASVDRANDLGYNFLKEVSYF